MLSPMPAPYASQEVVVVESPQSAPIAGVPVDHPGIRAAAAIVDPTPVRLNGEYKESEYGM